jgi:hypothetical protein
MKLLISCVHTAFCLWDKERSDETRTQIGMRKLDKYMEGRTIGWKISRGCYQRGLPSDYYIINRQEGLIQKGQEADGLMYEDRAG